MDFDASVLLLLRQVRDDGLLGAPENIPALGAQELCGTARAARAPIQNEDGR